jgi:GNAT superfamily N-acetyltransferase
MTKPVIRIARTDDLERILELYVFLNPANAVLAERDKLARTWSAILDDPRILCAVAEIEDVLIGSCELVVVPNLTHQARPFAIIDNVVTHPNHRRHGIGRQLVEYVLDHAWRQDCHKVLLQSAVRRKDAHLFYENLGFRSDLKVGFSIAHPDDA